MAVEASRGRDPKATHRRVRETGRTMPDGPGFVGGWVTADMGRGSRVAGTEQVTHFRSRVARWCDLAGFESVLVPPGNDAAEVLNGRL